MKTALFTSLALVILTVPAIGQPAAAADGTKVSVTVKTATGTVTKAIVTKTTGTPDPSILEDAPTVDEIVRALPRQRSDDLAFVAHQELGDLQITIEPIVDRIGELKHFPGVGSARLHQRHYKCTVEYERTLRSDWPVPFTHTEDVRENVYIDHDRLIRPDRPDER